MTEGPAYSYEASVKSDESDELINTYLLRPVAGNLVRLLYPTPVTPDHLTIAGIGAGFCAAVLYALGAPGLLAAAGLCVTAKDLLDTADGQLARAKQLYSRRGRFLDSIGDLVVNFFVFAAMGWTLARAGYPADAALAFLAFAGITLRVSYHVFYQTSFLHLRNAYSINRVIEEVREEDRKADRQTLMLQRIFVVLYGWQDRMMVSLDRWSRRGEHDRGSALLAWYSDKTALRLSSFIGLGTELFLLMMFSVAGELHAYLLFNITVMNAVWLASVLYRRLVVYVRVSGATDGPVTRS